MININDLFIFYSEFGYPGILIIGLIIGIIIFPPIPFFPVLMSASLDKSLDPTLIALFGAIGQAISKIIIFSFSYYGRNFFLSKKTMKRMMPIHRLLLRYGGIGACVAALSPIPDTVVYVSLGLAKYKIWKFAVAVFIGKFILNELIVTGTVFLGRPFIKNLVLGFTTEPITLVFLTIVGLSILSVSLYLLIKIDWAKVIGKWFPWTLADDTDHEKLDD